ncbi:Hypothetical protein ACGLYG10_2952 [Actinomyces glycerinitolerans]|uniref:Uncharacterized protein n=1 Tax=Actinomyces glycerinitolerans TaxID=1892869 RepID=A0A1M4S3D6_9ACTO|nr:Hypothetical protein ACGLYG10_2952 [Actinomyces glycerinitolerans]
MSNPESTGHSADLESSPASGSESEDLSWVKNSRFTIEEMRETAAEVLARFDRDREIQHLLRQGLTPQQVAERTGSEPRFVAHVGQQMQRGELVRPETPEELIFRRFLGQISSQEMMDRLRTWPYTFGRLRGYDGYERGSWDDVDGLHGLGYLSDQEYTELRAITDPMPKPPDDPMPWEKGWQPQ